jgi:DNA-binding phage protein
MCQLYANKQKTANVKFVKNTWLFSTQEAMHMYMNLEKELIERLDRLAKKRKISALAEKAGIEQSSLSRAFHT